MELNIIMFTQMADQTKVWDIRDPEAFEAFRTNANNTVLYQTEKLSIGEQYFPDIDIQATPGKRVDSGRNVSLSVMGIDILTSDLELKTISLQKIDNKVKATSTTIGSQKLR